MAGEDGFLGGALARDEWSKLPVALNMLANAIMANYPNNGVAQMVNQQYEIARANDVAMTQKEAQRQADKKANRKKNLALGATVAGGLAGGLAAPALGASVMSGISAGAGFGGGHALAGAARRARPMGGARGPGAGAGGVGDAERLGLLAPSEQ